MPAISGGTQATLQAPDIRLLGVPVTSDAGLYYVALAWCILVTSFMLNLRRTALGRALVAVREKDFAAAVIGVNSFYFKLVAFSTSSFIGGNEPTTSGSEGFAIPSKDVTGRTAYVCGTRSFESTAKTALSAAGVPVTVARGQNAFQDGQVDVSSTGSRHSRGGRAMTVE